MDAPHLSPCTQAPSARRLRALRTGATLALAVLLSAACDVIEEPEAPEPEPRPVKTLKLEAPDQLAERRFTGRIQSQHRAWVSFRVGGELEAMHADVGDHVEAGAVLAELDDEDYAREVEELEARLEAAKARHAFAATEYLRAASLVEEEAITRSEYDQAARQRDEARAEAASLRAGLALARDQLAYTRLEAPFDGAIAERRFDPHEAVPPQEPVFMLEDLEQLEVEVGIPEELMAFRDRIRDVRIRVPALDAVYPGLLRTVGVDIMPERQTYPIRAGITEPDEALLPGMTAEVILEADLSPDEHFRIPLTAVHEHDGERKVWIRDSDGQVYRRAVEIAALDRDSALVHSGLEAGDEVVTAGVHHLQPGQPTRRLEPEGP